MAGCIVSCWIALNIHTDRNIIRCWPRYFVYGVSFQPGYCVHGSQLLAWGILFMGSVFVQSLFFVNRMYI